MIAEIREIHRYAIAMTLTECFAHFGIDVGDNPRGAPWSGKASDGTVVVTLWSDQFLDTDRTRYSSGKHNPKTIVAWKNKQRIKDFQHAQERDSCFQSIIVTAITPEHNKFDL